MASLPLSEATANAIETFETGTRHLAEELEIAETGLDDLKLQALYKVNDLYSDVAKSILVLIPERPDFGPESALTARLNPQINIVLAAAFDSLLPKTGSANLRNSLLAIADAFPQQGKAKAMATFGKNLIPRHATTIHEMTKRLKDNTPGFAATPIPQMMRIIDVLNRARATRFQTRRGDIFYTKGDLTTAATTLLNHASPQLQIRQKRKAPPSQTEHNVSTKKAPATTVPVKPNKTSTTRIPVLPRPNTRPATNGSNPINDGPKHRMSSPDTVSNPSSAESESESDYDPRQNDTRHTSQQTNPELTVDKISYIGNQKNGNPHANDHDTDDDVIDHSVKRRRGIPHTVQLPIQGILSTTTYINSTYRAALY